MKFDWRNYIFEMSIIFVALCAFFVLFMTGCSWRTNPIDIVKPPTAITVAPNTTTEHARVESAEEKVSRLVGDLRAAQTQLDHARAAENEARLAGVRTLITWLTAIMALVGILSVGAFIFLRMKSLLVLTAACAAMIATAQATTVLLNHPIAAGCAVLALVVGVVGVVFWKQRNTECGLLASVQVVEALKPDPTTEDRVDREERRQMQARIVDGAGKAARSAIERARKKIANTLAKV